jgi:arylsulfatase A-like enzyme
MPIRAIRPLTPLASLVAAISCTACSTSPALESDEARLSRIIDDRPPNFVIIFIDDMGYADVGCFGAEGYVTPNLDRLADEGMRFTSFYASQAVCSASRASLITGCYANRVSVYGAYGPNAKQGLHPDEQTIAEVLKQRGYATAAIGKWHLGNRDGMWPTDQGFDEYLGLPYSNDMWPVDYDGTALTPEAPGGKPWKAKYPQLPLIEGRQTIDEIRTLADQGTLTTRYTERAVRFIDEHADEPFLLYLAHSMVHVPLGVSDRFEGQSEQGMFGDVMMEVDWSVGEVLRALRRNGLDERTLVVFTSDNGPWLNYGNHAGSAKPLREGKGAAFEGGVRVPCIMRWPGRIPAGSVCDRMGATLDLLPTFAALAGAPLPVRKIDGVSILPLLRGDSNAHPRNRLLYYYGRQLRAVREGRWKLVLPHESRSYQGVEPGRDGFPGPYARLDVERALYDLEADIGEQRDVAADHPEIVERLQAIAEHARETLGDAGRSGTEQRPPGKVE